MRQRFACHIGLSALIVYASASGAACAQDAEAAAPDPDNAPEAEQPPPELREPDPVVADPAGAAPAVDDPAVDDPAIDDPPIDEPAPADPLIAEPAPAEPEPPAERPTFYTQGRDLLDRHGRKVVLRGINKMSIYESIDTTGSVYLPEIRSTGANAIRIVWKIHDDAGRETSLALLDTLITGAHAQQLIPMVELHDVNDFADLSLLVAYWTRPDVVALIAKHQAYTLVNIGNEVGDDSVSAAQFLLGYTEAVQALRSAGIATPLVIDAPDYGKNLAVLDATASQLLAADPEQNLVFSVHMYWSKSCGADAAFIRQHLEASVALGYPLIVGEFSKYGGWPCGGIGTSMCQAAAEVDYRTILQVCAEQAIGWLVWEWGPGNAYNDPSCHVMDLTPDGLASHLKAGWAEEVVSSSPYSIANTSVIVDDL